MRRARPVPVLCGQQAEDWRLQEEGGELSGIALQRGPTHVRPILRLCFFNTLDEAVSTYSSAAKLSPSD